MHLLTCDMIRGLCMGTPRMTDNYNTESFFCKVLQGWECGSRRRFGIGYRLTTRTSELFSFRPSMMAPRPAMFLI
jgi:hypothetical protein